MIIQIDIEINNIIEYPEKQLSLTCNYSLFYEL